MYVALMLSRDIHDDASQLFEAHVYQLCYEYYLSVHTTFGLYWYNDYAFTNICSVLFTFTLQKVESLCLWFDVFTSLAYS